MPIEHPYFGKLFRCPNHLVENDPDRREKLLKVSNLKAFSDKTFDNFNAELPGLRADEAHSLELAYRLARTYAENPHGWLLLSGGYGCGKTHLAAAVGNLRVTHGDTVLFMTSPDLLDHLRSHYAPTAEAGYDDVFERVRNVPLLILDDLGTENQSQWAMEKLFQLLNHRHSHQLATVVTTNIDLETLDPRLRSRLLDESIVRRAQINAPDYRTSARQQREMGLSYLSYYAHMTFDTFDAKRNLTPDEQRNLQQAYNIALEYARETPALWLVFHSKFFGSGKTHLAAAIGNAWEASGQRVNFITVPDLLDHLRDAYNPGSSSTFDERFQALRSAERLILDDLGLESAKPWAKEKLFQLLDHRYVRGLPTVITTSMNIDNIDERIQTRIADARRCRLVFITARDYATRSRRS